MKIRPAEAEDSVALAEIVVAGWRWAYRGVLSDQELDALDVGRGMRRIRERFDSRVLFRVAVDESEVPIGFAVESSPQLEEFDCEIGGLYVHPEKARGGVGRGLVQAMVREFKNRGNKTMAIHTLRKNRIGRGFYERIGGELGLEDEWRGYPAVWYVWRDLDIFENF